MVSKTAVETTVVEATVASVVSLRQRTQQWNKPNECSSVFNLTLLWKGRLFVGPRPRLQFPQHTQFLAQRIVLHRRQRNQVLWSGCWSISRIGRQARLLDIQHNEIVLANGDELSRFRQTES